MALSRCFSLFHQSWQGWLVRAGLERHQVAFDDLYFSMLYC
jgi:hypothetical protein